MERRGESGSRDPSRDTIVGEQEFQKGQTVNIRSTEGQMESDWVILGFDRETATVVVKKTDEKGMLKKRVTIAELEEWNAEPTASNKTPSEKQEKDRKFAEVAQELLAIAKKELDQATDEKGVREVFKRWYKEIEKQNKTLFPEYHHFEEEKITNRIGSVEQEVGGAAYYLDLRENVTARGKYFDSLLWKNGKIIFS